jgi:hypothetical protein
MKSVPTAAHRIASPSAQMWIVVSSSAYGGIEVPVDMILAEMAERVGWFLKEIGVIRHLRHSGHHWQRLPDDERATVRFCLGMPRFRPPNAISAATRNLAKR